MPIFKLTPVDLSRPCWTASTHKGQAIVRAVDEHRGRQVVDAAFNMAVERPHSWGDITTPPWMDEFETRCERIENADYAEDGPDEILDPEWD